MITEKQKEQGAKAKAEEEIYKDSQINRNLMNVLEYLTKELIQLKTLHPGKYKKRRTSSSSADDSPSSEDQED